MRSQSLSIVDLRSRDLTFCQFFLSSETRKLISAHILSQWHGLTLTWVISMSPTTTQTQNFLKLELDQSWRRADLGDLIGQILGVGGPGSFQLLKVQIKTHREPTRQGICYLFSLLLIDAWDARQTSLRASYSRLFIWWHSHTFFL